MKVCKIDNLTEENGQYTLDGIPLTNFILRFVKVVISGTQMDVYRFEVIKDKEVYRIEMPYSKLIKTKFLQNVPVFIENEQKFYDLLRRTVQRMELSENEIWHQTNCNGLQKVNDRYMFVFTNGSVGEDGFHREIYSGVGKMYVPPEAVQGEENLKETIRKLFAQFNCNPSVFYPLFFCNLMAIMNGFYRTIGEMAFMKITFWLDGTSGSGKTELAKAVGTYVFGDEQRQKCLVYATGRRKQILQSLSYSSGSVFILDDVKNERVRDRKNSVRNVVDDCIRSVFQGRLTESLNKETGQDWIDCCAIITGEYMDTEESQNARIFLLKLDGFLNDERNSEALRTLQENSIWLTSVCCGYIRWFLKMIGESSFSEFLKGKLKEMRNSEKLYQDVSNAGRLNENRHMIDMAAVLAEKYFSDIGMGKGFVEKFSQNARFSIKAITDDTFVLLGGEQMIAYKAMERLFKTCRVRNARYKKISYNNGGYKYDQKYFCIDEEEDFVWISDYKKSLLKSEEGEHDLFDENPCLIISFDRFEYLFKAEIQQLSKEIRLSSVIIDNLMSNWSRKLRKMQIVYKQKRSDSPLGRPAIEYPVYELKSNMYQYGYEDCYDISTRSPNIYMNVHYTPVIQINTRLPYIEILKERMNNEEELEERENWTISEQVKDIIEKRKAFIAGKSLYKE